VDHAEGVIERSRGVARETEPDKVPFEILSDIDGELVFISPKDGNTFFLTTETSLYSVRVK